MPIPNNIKIIFEYKAIFVMKEYLSKTDSRANRQRQESDLGCTTGDFILLW
jgi:hypothetical protein